MHDHGRVTRPGLWVRALLLLIAALGLVMLSAMASPALAGTDKGEVVFRVTLTGPVDPDDHFIIHLRCPDEWCQPPSIPGMPTPEDYEKPVVVCGRNLADQPICSARTYEWTLELIPGTLHYRFEREPDGANDPTGSGPSQTLVEGTWQVHSGRQVLTFEYVYPSAGSELPTTSVAPPSTEDGHLSIVLVTAVVGGASVWETRIRKRRPA